MSDSEIRELANELMSDRSRFIYKPKELETFLVSRGIESKEEILLLSRYLVEGDIFRWLDFIGLKLPQLASTDDDFVNLLSIIISKVKSDMAQGPFIRGLINIGASNPKVGLELFEKMAESDDKDVVSYSGLILGGSGKKEFGRVFPRIVDNVKSQDSDIQATSIKALRVIFEDRNLSETAPNILEKVFQVLRDLTSPNVDSKIRSQVSNAYIDFYKFDPEQCYGRLKDLAQQKDSNIRFTIADRLFFIDLKDGKQEMALLKECSQDDNPYTLEKVAFALSKKGKYFPEESLEIIKDWTKRGKFYKINILEYCLQEIGKGNLDQCIKTIETWIRGEKDPLLRFHIPKILSKISISNYTKLYSHLEKWSDGKETDYHNIVVETVKETLSSENIPSEIVERGKNILKKMT